jgi:hypothetical protein
VPGTFFFPDLVPGTFFFLFLSGLESKMKSSAKEILFKIIDKHSMSHECCACVVGEDIFLGGVPTDEVYFSLKHDTNIIIGKCVVSYISKLFHKTNIIISDMLSRNISHEDILSKIGLASHLPSPINKPDYEWMNLRDMMGISLPWICRLQNSKIEFLSRHKCVTKWPLYNFSREYSSSIESILTHNK